MGRYFVHIEINIVFYIGIVIDVKFATGVKVIENIGLTLLLVPRDHE